MRLGSWLWVLGLPIACSSGSDEGSPFGNSAGSLGTSPTASSTSDASSGAAESSGPGDDDTGSGGQATTSAESTTGTTGVGTAGDTNGVTTSACMGVPTGMSALGENCIDGCECSSGICFALPLVGSACSECLNDAECLVAGVGTCSVNTTTQSASCTSGELGVMCDPAVMGCAAGLSCEQLVDTGGVLPDTFCSQCGTAADCAAGEVCTPNVIIDGLSPGGFLQCIPQGTGADGTFCPATGDASPCASGICAVVDIAGLGIAEVGVCGPCASDADCPGGTCQPPEIDETGATPSQCV